MNREKGSDKFVSYLRKHKKQKWLESRVYFVRKANGLGEPAEEYNQNANECINSVLKRSKGNYKISLKEAIQLVHNEVKLQEETLKLAIVAKVPWRIQTAYKAASFGRVLLPAKLRTEKEVNVFVFSNLHEIWVTSIRLHEIVCGFVQTT